MLKSLHQAIQESQTVDPIEEYLFESTSDAVKSAFLDDVEGAVLGAEEDSSLDKEISKIPEYEDADPEFEKKLEKVIESVTY